jgi:hypothetical protein
VWTKAYLKQKNAKNLKTNKKVFLIPCKEKEKENFIIKTIKKKKKKKKKKKNKKFKKKKKRGGKEKRS